MEASKREQRPRYCLEWNKFFFFFFFRSTWVLCGRNTHSRAHVFRWELVIIGKKRIDFYLFFLWRGNQIGINHIGWGGYLLRWLIVQRDDDPSFVTYPAEKVVKSSGQYAAVFLLLILFLFLLFCVLFPRERERWHNSALTSYENAQDHK